MGNNELLEQAKRLVEAMDKTADDNLPEKIAEIVKFHSKGSALSAMGSGWIPGAGGILAFVINAGFIWSMYGRIGAEIDLPISQNILKSLASGIATNIASNIIGTIGLSIAFSFIPGVGNIGAAIIIGATCYALTLTSGYVYLKIMTKLFSKGIDPTTLSEKELKKEAKSVAKDRDVKDMFNKAKEMSKSELEKDEQEKQKEKSK